MTKPFTIPSFWFLVLLTSVFIYSCQSNTDTPVSTDISASKDSTTFIPYQPEKEKAAVLAINRQVLEVLKSKDYSQLSSFVHPVKGVRFSIAGYVDTANDQGFSPERLNNYTTSKKMQKLVWGINMEGDSIRQTLPEYLAKKVYGKDFYNADSVGYNIIYHTGSDPKMMETVYGHAPFVSNFFGGDEKKYGGIDWLALRLIFEKYDEQYYLVGVINDEWTP
jgi:hypothetical protein